jgi:hypothetical protein
LVQFHVIAHDLEPHDFFAHVIDVIRNR